MHDDAYFPTTPIRPGLYSAKEPGDRFSRRVRLKGGVFRSTDGEPFRWTQTMLWHTIHYVEQGRLYDIMRDQRGPTDTKTLSKLYDPEHDDFCQREWITHTMSAAVRKKAFRRVGRGRYINSLDVAHPLTTIKTHKVGERVVGLLLVQHWMLGRIAPIYNNHVVVATWMEFSDGPPSAPTVVCEAKTTVAVVAKMEDAEILYEAYIFKYEQL